MNDTAIVVTCGTCAKAYKWKPELAGKRAKCKCGGRVQFPMEDPAPPAREVDLLDDPMVGGGGESEGAAAGEYDLNEPVKPVAKAAPAAAPVQGRGGAAGGPAGAGVMCKGCGNGLSDGAVLCMKCGMNQKTGKKLGTAVDRGGLAGKSAGAGASVATKGGGVGAALMPWLMVAGAVVVAVIVGAVGMFALAPEVGVKVCQGVVIAGVVLNAIGTIWGIRVAAGDNIGLRIACRFVPFLAWGLIIKHCFGGWEEIKGPVLTIIAGIGVAVVGLVMWIATGVHGAIAMAGQ